MADFRKIFCWSMFGWVYLQMVACTPHKHEQLAENEFYTCSMDPQVRLKEPGKCPICKMELTKVVIGDTMDNALKLSSEQVSLANIRTEIAALENLPSEHILMARVGPDPNKVQTLTARFPGRIEKLYIKSTGGKVQKGQVLYEVYSEELIALQNELLSARAKPAGDWAEAAINKLKLWGISQQQIDGLIEQNKVADRFAVRSPYGGTVTEVNVKEGEYINEGSPLFALADFSTVWVNAEAYAKDYDWLKEGTQVWVKLPSLPGATFKGKLVLEAPELKTSSIAHSVWVEIPNANGGLKPGMQAYIYPGAAAEKVLAVPTNAVIREAAGSSVWIKNKDGNYENRMVHTGNETSEKVEIRHGLQEGDEVVVNGAYLLHSEYIFKKGKNAMQGHEM